MNLQELKKEFEPREVLEDPLAMPDTLNPRKRAYGDKKAYDYLLKLERNPKKLQCLNYMIFRPELSQKEIAEEVKVTEKTICAWKTEDIFLMLLSRGLNNQWVNHKNNILTMLYQKSLGGDLKASELLLKEIN